MAQKIITIHNVKEWFGSDDLFLAYFENDFDKNTIGRFKAPGSTVRRHNNLATDADRAKLAATIANIYISAVVSSPKGKLLPSIEFAWLLPETREILKSAAAEAVQHAVLNRHVWEKVNASSISTPNFSMNVDTTNWLLSSDMFGMIAKNMITNSQLGKYKIVGDAFLGEIEMYDAATGNVVLHKWDNTGKSQDAIDGNRYLVYEDYILVGTKGIDGKDGKDLDVSGLQPDQIIKGVQGTLTGGLVGPQGPKGDDGLPGQGIVVKGSKADETIIQALPNPTIADAYIALNTGSLWVYSATGWLDAGKFEGPRGAQGAQGLKGDKGDKGEKGDTGATGQAGHDGTNGIQGPQGPKGDTGLVGAKGLKGDKGERGDRGIQGPRGDQGADGRSFQIVGSRDTAATIKLITGAAIGDGYIALDTENLWGFTPTGWQDLGNLSGPQGRQGEQGIKGDTGAQGPKGEKGDKGDKGDQGIQGIQGPRGQQGIQGTPGATGADGQNFVTPNTITVTYDDGTTGSFKVG